MATAQLQLIHTDHTWKLDQHTVKVGRAGIAQARAALAAATKESETDGQLFSYSVGRTDDRTGGSTESTESTRRRPGRDDAQASGSGHRAAA